MGAPKTVEEAQNLPEISNILSGGYFLGKGGIDGDSIMLFIDKDGIPKRIGCIRRTPEGPDEWVKIPFNL